MTSKTLATGVLLDVLRSQVGSYAVAVGPGPAKFVREVCDELQSAVDALTQALAQAQEENGKLACEIVRAAEAQMKAEAALLRVTEGGW